MKLFSSMFHAYLFYFSGCIFCFMHVMLTITALTEKLSSRKEGNDKNKKNGKYRRDKKK